MFFLRDQNKKGGGTLKQDVLSGFDLIHGDNEKDTNVFFAERYINVS